MKKIITIALAVFLSVGTVSAQNGSGRKRMSTENRVAQMTKELNLTPEQQKKITAIYTELEAKRKAGGQTSREQMRAEMEKTDQKINEVLTKTQQKKYAEMKQARQNRRHQ